MGFWVTASAICLAIALVLTMIVRVLIRLGRQNRPGESLYLLDTIDQIEASGSGILAKRKPKPKPQKK